MAVSPMMRQYEEAKAACGDALLLFRMGDFYELFHEDAKICARVLGLTLTSRDKGENAIPMAGFPHHQLEGYLAKLIQQGYRVAVCDQVEDPRQAKGLVRREVTRIVTPGTLTDDALLDPRQPNLLLAIYSPNVGAAEGDVGLAWTELSTGQFAATIVPRNKVGDELARLQPSEVLLRDDDSLLSPGEDAPWAVTLRPAWEFSPREAKQTLCEHFGVSSLEGMGWDESSDGPAIGAAGAVLAYLRETQKTALTHLHAPVPWRQGSQLEIDAATRRSLELTHTIRDRDRSGSLLAVLDKTCTSMGARLLSAWLASPLTDVAAITERHDAVAELFQNDRLRRNVRDQLAGVYDLQRLLSRVATGRATPRDLRQVGLSLKKLPELKALLAQCQATLWRRLTGQLDPCEQLADRLLAALEDECPLHQRDGGFIRAGFSAELDALRDTAKGGKQWIAAYQQKQIEESGIPSLKVGYTKVFGYYLEVTNTHKDKIPPHYIRKQTLKNAERYVTEELKAHEERVLEAEERSVELEIEIFQQLRDEVAGHLTTLQRSAEVIAQTDVLAGLAELARTNNYVRPEITDEDELEIVEGRHPVLDALQPKGTFVPNDCHVGGQHGTIMLITGPNMAGKSTYIRQVALITLMAQLGSFVPASRATIGVVDKIFARVGASDELARGQSTFMVEMVETARILNTATSRSLIILDEIGRGTSTYDGLSLAWAIVEYLHDVVRAKTLFATHYHELTQLEMSLPQVRNYNVSVREWNDEIVFLHRITRGGADKSYGIHVARLAGIPPAVNDRAKEVLEHLEEDHINSRGESKITPPRRSKDAPIQLTLFEFADHPVLDKLRELDVTAITPMQALQLLQQWQQELQGDRAASR